MARPPRSAQGLTGTGSGAKESAGVIASIAVAEGTDNVKVGTVIATLTGDDEAARRTVATVRRSVSCWVTTTRAERRAAAGTSVGRRAALAPRATMISFCPAELTRMAAVPV
eukprot:gene49271-66904_t